MDLGLLLEDQEDKGRKSNMRVRGVLESEGTNDIQEIFQGRFTLMFLPADGVTMPVKVYRAYCLSGPHSIDPMMLYRVLVRFRAPMSLTCQLGALHE